MLADIRKNEAKALLIVPYGIEIFEKHIPDAGKLTFNRTLWN